VQLLVALFYNINQLYNLSPIFKQTHFILGDWGISFYFYRCINFYADKTITKKQLTNN
jgi:hypothetical protein